MLLITLMAGMYTLMILEEQSGKDFLQELKQLLLVCQSGFKIASSMYYCVLKADFSKPSHTSMHISLFRPLENINKSFSVLHQFLFF